MRRLLLLMVLLSCKTPETSSLQDDDSGPGVVRYKFDSGARYLIVELLDDDLAHFEISERTDGPSYTDGIYTTPMVAKRAWRGPSSVQQEGNTLRTPELELRVYPSSLCVEATDRKRNVPLTRVCTEQLNQAEKKLIIDPKKATHAYGVGNFFIDPSTADGDWSGREWKAQGLGNVRADFNGAAPSMSQFPVVYAAGQGQEAYALFVDMPYRLSWSFKDPKRWTAETWGDQVRFYLMAGPSLKDLRSDFLELTGRPPVPPKALFGLWVSEFGYDNWAELKDDLASLRQNGFPVDGFGLDLQWFGAGFDDRTRFKMGTLRFDPNWFKNAAAEVDSLRRKDGVRLMAIEESYVNRALPEYDQLLAAGQGKGCFFARKDAEGCRPVEFGNQNQPIWWGWGGMIDWTNDAAGDYWHATKRDALAKMGVNGHWTDLGEPEMYDDNAYYHGFPGLPTKNRHGDVHNLYNFKWLESIWRGYARMTDPPRFYSMSRAGAPGIQRFGAGMWSGDVGRNMGSLRAHLNTQMHMTMAGVDYYGSDAGGFTWALNSFFNDAKTDEQYRELYTQWLAASLLADIPVRPHGWAKDDQETRYGPDHKGHKESNLANVRLRYELSPYYYSLAHRAYERGEPIVPPLVYHFPEDLKARELSNVKMLGDALLFAIVANYGETERRVHLPKGRWYNFHTHEGFDGVGGDTEPYPVYLKGLFTLPLFAREGAIVPLMHVDAATENVMGKRKDGTRRDDLVARVYASGALTETTVYEDDGETQAYQRGEVRKTRITQQRQANKAAVTFEAASGGYAGAPTTRPKKVQLVARDAKGTGASLNGQVLGPCPNRKEFDDGAAACWMNDGGLVLVRTASSVDAAAAARFEIALEPVGAKTSAHFVCNEGKTQPGESIYVVGEGLPGGWTGNGAVKLEPTRYPRWTGWVDGLAANATIKWKCFRKKDGASGAYEDGPDHVLKTGGAGFAGTTIGDF